MNHLSLLKLYIAFAGLAIGTQANAYADTPIRVAVFKGEGVGSSVNDLIKSLGGMESQEFTIRRVTANEIRSGELSGVDVLIHPGGSGSRQGKALGEEGRKAVTAFVANGGGFLGVCAGGYLATNDYSWSLNLIDAKAVDRKHWARGNGTVKLQLSPVGASFFCHIGEDIDIHYGHGPCWGDGSGTTKMFLTIKAWRSTKPALHRKAPPKE